MLESIPLQLRIIALVGAVIVAVVALIALRGEWHKTQLEDHVTKIMMVLLTVGCVEVFLVAIGKIGRL
jgi:hypothetical protein